MLHEVHMDLKDRGCSGSYDNWIGWCVVTFHKGFELIEGTVNGLSNM